MKEDKDILLELLYKMADAAKVPHAFFDPYKKGHRMPENWYQAYTWTEKQQEDFKEYLISYFKKTFKMKRKKAELEAGMFLLSWGWKCSEWK